VFGATAELGAAMPYALLLTVLLSAGLTRVAIAYADRRKLLDLPGHRRSHVQPTPRGGGIAPVVTILVVGLGMVWPFDPRRYVAVAVALALVAAIGWWDDHRPLSVSVRLLAQALICTGTAWSALRPEFHSVFLSAALTVALALWLLGYLNLHNFMDGINGLTASQTVFCAAAFAAFAFARGAVALAWLAAVTAVATAAFLPFNFPRARIFLGDVGSTALGFMLAAIAVMLAQSATLRFGSALILMSAFLVDGGLTLAYRMLRGTRWWRPHREHLYQWLVRCGTPQTRIVACYLGWNLLLALPFAWLNERPWMHPSDTASFGGLGYTAALPALVFALAAATWFVGKRWCRARLLGLN
jgi:Fuc2NAc and GlcNAc transferase